MHVDYWKYDLWITLSVTMFMVHSKKFQIEQVTFIVVIWTTFMTPGWIDQINCMTNVITGGSTSISLCNQLLLKRMHDNHVIIVTSLQKYFHWFNYTICLNWLLHIIHEFNYIVSILVQWMWGIRFWDGTFQFVYLHPVPFPPILELLANVRHMKERYT